MHVTDCSESALGACFDWLRSRIGVRDEPALAGR